jgi:Flp pilus assembly protein TadD
MVELKSPVNLPIIQHCGVLALLLAASAAVAAGQNESQEQKAERARSALAEERFDDAAALYADLVKASPGNTGLRMSLGLAQLARKQYAKAAAEFQVVVKKDPKFAGAWQVLGQCYGKLGEKEKASAALRTALQLEPRNLEVRLEYAAALLVEKKNREASDEFWTIAQTNRSDPRVWHGLAVSNAALARAEKDETKKTELISRAQQALQQLRDTAGPAEEELLREASAAVEPVKP